MVDAKSKITEVEVDMPLPCFEGNWVEGEWSLLHVETRAAEVGKASSLLPVRGQCVVEIERKWLSQLLE